MAKEFNPEEMDRAAEEARQKLEELNESLDDRGQEVLMSVAHWFSSYYLKAGHKRLGRILVGIHNKQKRS